MDQFINVVSRDLETIQKDVSYIKIQLQSLISIIKVMEENKKESIPTKEEVSKGWFFS
tara:strand:+ start:9548 stop:9721 length:174 start_codon:yes stop_codon:yes gene_type:complete